MATAPPTGPVGPPVSGTPANAPPPGPKQFDASQIAIFRAGDWTGVAPNQVFTPDTTCTYAMISQMLYDEAVAGLTAAQLLVVNSYRYTPTALDANRGFPAWGGNDPVAVYFKSTAATTPLQMQKLQTALARRFK